MNVSAEFMQCFGVLSDRKYIILCFGFVCDKMKMNETFFSQLHSMHPEPCDTLCTMCVEAKTSIM